MPDYSKCVIYKLCCKNLNIKEIYVGSTCNFRNRKWGHKSKCHNENDKDYNYPVYKFIRDTGGFKNWDMILVEEYSCENKQQKLQRERYWYEELKADLNRDCPGRDLKEYKKYYDETHREQNKEKHKKYYETHKEEAKKYHQENKEQISERKKTKVICECGAEVCKNGIARHERSKKHLDFINEN